jgi:thiosulfate/3-mercaptopyruvate sulfurtransferase
LRERFVAVGVTDGATVVSYCGSGVTACHNLLALERAGFAPGRSTRARGRSTAPPDRPAATGRLGRSGLAGQVARLGDGVRARVLR